MATRFKGKEAEAVYGPVGTLLSAPRFFGKIVQTNGTTIGFKLKEDAIVQTLDAMCLMAHSTVFKQGLYFDEKFRFHLYAADLCMQAYRLGFDILAMQLDCQHKSKTLWGDVYSPEYLSSLELFREKWKQFLPIRATTGLIE